MPKSNSSKKQHNNSYNLVIGVQLLVLSVLLIKFLLKKPEIQQISPTSNEQITTTITGTLQSETTPQNNERFYISDEIGDVFYLDKSDLESYLNQKVQVSGNFIPPEGVIPGFITINSINLAK